MVDVWGDAIAGIRDKFKNIQGPGTVPSAQPPPVTGFSGGSPGSGYDASLATSPLADSAGGSGIMTPGSEEWLAKKADVYKLRNEPDMEYQQAMIKSMMGRSGTQIGTPGANIFSRNVLAPYNKGLQAYLGDQEIWASEFNQADRKDKLNILGEAASQPGATPETVDQYNTSMNEYMGTTGINYIATPTESAASDTFYAENIPRIEELGIRADSAGTQITAKEGYYQNVQSPIQLQIAAAQYGLTPEQFIAERDQFYTDRDRLYYLSKLIDRGATFSEDLFIEMENLITKFGG